MILKQSHNPSANKRKSIAEKKLELLSKCTDAITTNAKSSKAIEIAPKRSAFGMYIEERLSQLGKRGRRIAEKRINDVLFEIEMAVESRDGPATPQQYGNRENQIHYAQREYQSLPVIPTFAQRDYGQMDYGQRDFQHFGNRESAETRVGNNSYASMTSPPGQKSYMDLINE